MGDNGISSDIWSSLLLFHSNVLPPLPTIFTAVYFSFLPVNQRDFPGNVRSGGRDSLPPVVAFTSKQRDSPLSYALHFLRLRSHQMCCAGERAEGRALPLPPPPGWKRRSGGSFSRASQALPALGFNPRDLPFSPAWRSRSFSSKRGKHLLAKHGVTARSCTDPPSQRSGPRWARRAARAGEGKSGKCVRSGSWRPCRWA